MARLLRHEVGDLLQSIYAIVAIVLERLPTDFSLERRLVGELKGRAEVTRLQIDAVVDLVMPGQLDLTRTDLVPFAARGPGRDSPAVPCVESGHRRRE